VTLRCTCDTSSSYVYLYWFRQFPNTEPEYLLWKAAQAWSYKEDISNDQFQSTTPYSSTSLTIDEAALLDLALYYCAMKIQLYSSVYKNSHTKILL